MTMNENGDTTITLTVKTSMPGEIVNALLDHTRQLLEESKAAGDFVAKVKIAKVDELHRVIAQIYRVI